MTDGETLQGWGGRDPDDLAVVCCAALHRAGVPCTVVLDLSSGEATAIHVFSDERLVGVFPMHPVKLSQGMASELAASIELSGRLEALRAQLVSDAKERAAVPNEFFAVENAACTKLDRRYVDGSAREPGVRLYRTQSERLGSLWCLQIRAPLRLSNGDVGRDFILAALNLDDEQMRQLRTMIDAQLADSGSDRT